ncbi:hypothetical protein Pmar_PMAR029026 [Perkinsus marinus ATCC 50983]|uniref:Uncharacterized protein n=1 Tax=Perkinsus marinus (strain ATCC 50983 / TXsc) TaxID=423536 RepID=C5L6B0_PERM5|nr:hypothetical protein Pmar_PMAR029026 [Perkinsus marinus ATCC 50983]EER07737.1 hypothetical protein Pmar_PMAR029026 [Perkinsus marinus ATCC 50983]|eukprot:XP_002775921.1 hypothetical protein Pmar_PMAR029026 [Perkinsus marinus ATCC 50983]
MAEDGGGAYGDGNERIHYGASLLEGRSNPHSIGGTEVWGCVQMYKRATPVIRSNRVIGGQIAAKTASQSTQRDTLPSKRQKIIWPGV